MKNKSLLIALVIIGLVITAAVFLWMRYEKVPVSPTQASTQPTQTNQSQVKITYGDWAVRCSTGNARACEAFQRLSVAETGARVAEMAVGFPPGNVRGAKAMVILPLGVRIDQPVSLTVDKGGPSRTVTVQTCTKGGCTGQITLDDEMLNAMRSGDTVTVSFQVASGQKANLDLSLKGFSLALGDLLG